MRSLSDLPDRITKRFTPDGDCLVWTGSKNAKGYGSVWWNGSTQLVHRVVFSQLIAPIPDGLLVCHACDTPACAKPTHLMLGTHEANITDAIHKGRVTRRDGCIVDDCDRDHLARGWCGLHYQRWATTGNPLELHPASAPVRAAREVCHRGHRFDTANTKLRANGTRECRACSTERTRRYRQAVA